MKACPKCGAENSNSAVFCENCQSYIENEKNVETDLINSIAEKEEKKEKFRRGLDWTIGIVYVVLYIALYIKALACGNISGIGPLLPVMLATVYFVCVFKPEAIFFLENMLKIDNIEDVKISDWYYISNRIGAYLFLCVGIVFIFSQAFVVKNPNGVVVETGYGTTGYSFENELPSDEKLSECGAVNIENNTEAQAKLEQFYSMYSAGMPDKIILIADNKIFEMVYSGGKMCCHVDTYKDDVRSIEYNYNCEMVRIDKSYTINDKISGFSYEFAF